MTEIQWFEVVDGIFNKLWPEWIANEVELESWYKKLKYFEQSVVRKASQEFYSTPQGNFKRPKLHAIVKLCKEYSQKPESEKTAGEPLLIYTIECIGHEDSNYIGRKYRHYSSGKMKKEDINEETCIADAEKTVAKYNESPGGTWVYHRDWTELNKEGQA